MLSYTSKRLTTIGYLPQNNKTKARLISKGFDQLAIRVTNSHRTTALPGKKIEPFLSKALKALS